MILITALRLKVRGRQKFPSGTCYKYFSVVKGEFSRPHKAMTKGWYNSTISLRKGKHR